NYRENDMIFDIEKFLEFEGNTGPYLLYSYARASSILKKVRKERKVTEIKSMSEEEKNLIKKLSLFEDVVKESAEKFSPNILANYSFELCQIFNEFYHTNQVIGSEKESFRIKLIEIFTSVLKKCLNLLGIQEIEEM
ncbi:MAG: DALR anticodon-binding domain-containing protein, partial [Candidatus Pacearchaeota archaeon]